MDYVLVRYDEIGTKAEPVRSDMQKILRQRVEDRLEYEEIEYSKVALMEGRIIVEGTDAEEAAEKISELPGVASTSPAMKTDSSIEAMKEASNEFRIGRTFGVRANRSGEHEFSSKDIEREIGDFIRKSENAEVDLENPETWIRYDIRHEDTYVFTERFEGPGGFPVGTGSPVAALISGGIDSPVAAKEMMNRGSDIIPVYFYNKPIAAEDHLIRFEAVLQQLKRIHPSKEWRYYVVDLEDINEELMKIERGRMIIHRHLMFNVAEHISEEENLDGITTGESASQKSSQTVSNLNKTSQAVNLPIFRPLLTERKSDITKRARDLGTYRHSKIDSACRSLSPDNPATRIDENRIRNLKKEIGFDGLVEKALENMEEKTL